MTNTAQSSQFDVSTFDPGPRSFSVAAEPKGAAFCMSTGKWLSLQSFFNDVTQLPATLDALKKKMGPGAPSSMADFKQLVDLYVTLQGHGANFTANIYPPIVRLASDISEYASDLKGYYGPDGLQGCIDQLAATPRPTGAALDAIKSTMTAIISGIVESISQLITNAANVNTLLKNFVPLLQSDLNTLGSSVAPGSGYWKYYNDEYGSNSAAVNGPGGLNDQIAKLRAEIGPLEDEYNHDVIVAATAAAYVWIYPLGTIAAVVVAGLYGSNASAVKAALDAVQKTIKELEDDVAADVALMSDLNNCTGWISDLSEHFSKALGILEGVEGNWSAINDDLNHLLDVMQNDFERTIPVLLKIDFNNAIRDWGDLKVQADIYRNNAYISVNT